MKKNRLFIYLLSALGWWLVSACSESDLLLSGQQAVVVGNVSVEADTSDAAEQIKNESLGYYGVQLVGALENPDGVEIENYGVLLSKVSHFSLSQAEEYAGEKLGELPNLAGDSYSVKLDGLEDATTYYYRFFARHAKGVSYSAHQDANTFTTKKHERVPETVLLTKEYIDVLEIKCAIEHDGHFPIMECGIYIGDAPDNLPTKIKVSKLPAVENHKAQFVVNVANCGLNVGDEFYCQSYAISEKGEGKGEVVKLRVEKLKSYVKLAVAGCEIHKDKVKLTIKVESIGNGPVTEYGYYDVLTGDKVVKGTALQEGQTETWTFEDLEMGVKQTIYLYGINADGESPEPEEDDYYSFMAGITGKNEDDKDLIYLELPAIESGGKKYYFLDRNLGATAAYATGAIPGTYEELGWLFQVGRKADGHQWLNSPNLNIRSTFATVQEAEAAVAAENAKNPTGWQKSRFLANGNSPWSWMENSAEEFPKLWTDEADGGMHNPCPEGYRLPTVDELYMLMENKNQMKLGADFRWRAGSGSGIKANGNGYFWGAYDTEKKKYPAMNIFDDISKEGTIAYPSGGQGCYVRCVRVE